MSVLSALRSLFVLGKGTVVGLSEGAAGDDPIALFQTWFADARASSILLPEAMSVATVGSDGAPSARMMLLKGVDDRGFVFYTNHESRKAGEIGANANVALVFHWAILQRQVRVEGTAERLSDDESTAYFRTRPRGSRIGAWASQQSRELENRAQLDERYREFNRKYPGDDVPLPSFWGGYRVAPATIEFWQGRINRLHDRLCFRRRRDTWTCTRLYP